MVVLDIKVILPLTVIDSSWVSKLVEGLNAVWLIRPTSLGFKLAHVSSKAKNPLGGDTDVEVEYFQIAA